MSQASLEHKTAIVTGSSQGIGCAIAYALAARGANVVVNYPSDPEAGRAAAVAEGIRTLGRHALSVRADVTHVAEIRALFDQAEARFGRIDIVVSNAGGAARLTPIAEVTEAEYDAATALNAKAHFFVLQEAARRLPNDGRIVVIASSTTAMPYAGSATYAGAKAAAELYARVLAKEVGVRGITVNAVSPGPILTEAARAAGSLVRFDTALKMTPLGRLGEPEDVADVVAFLATHEARWITGQNIRAGGGLV
jgi:3-oxoacyl-[acyl-carrier protein] reductase